MVAYWASGLKEMAIKESQLLDNVGHMLGYIETRSSATAEIPERDIALFC